MTGELLRPSEERVLALGEAPKRILVATDCLSEGINQEQFDAVVHYDLSWNPTATSSARARRPPQPAERDRPRPDVLRERQPHRRDRPRRPPPKEHIRDLSGSRSPSPWTRTPCSRRSWLILRGATSQLSLFDEPELESERDVFHSEWDIAADREKRSRTVFAQETIKVDEVERELLETRAAIGSGADVRSFVEHALRAEGAIVTVAMSSCSTLRRPRALRDPLPSARRRRFAPTSSSREGRCHVPLAHIPSLMDSPVRRGRLSIRSSPVRRSERSNSHASGCDPYDLLLVRLRFDVVTRSGRSSDGRSPRRPGSSASRSARAAVWLTDQDAAARSTRHPTATSPRARRRLRPNGGRWSRSARAVSR